MIHILLGMNDLIKNPNKNIKIRHFEIPGKHDLTFSNGSKSGTVSKLPVQPQQKLNISNTQSTNIDQLYNRRSFF